LVLEMTLATLLPYNHVVRRESGRVLGIHSLFRPFAAGQVAYHRLSALPLSVAIVDASKGWVKTILRNEDSSQLIAKSFPKPLKTRANAKRAVMFWE